MNTYGNPAPRIGKTAGGDGIIRRAMRKKKAKKRKAPMNQRLNEYPTIR